MKSKKSKTVLPPLLKEICLLLDEKKAEDVKVLDVSAQSSITDYLVLGTGTSEPHLRALRVELEKIIDRSGARIVGMDTGLGSGWLVIDAFDIMVHVFTQENRRKYALESLWKDAEEIAVSKVLVTEKKVSAKSKSKRTAKRTTQPPKSKKRRSNKK